MIFLRFTIVFANKVVKGGGVRVHITEVVAIASILIPSDDIQLEIVDEEV